MLNSARRYTPYHTTFDETEITARARSVVNDCPRDRQLLWSGIKGSLKGYTLLKCARPPGVPRQKRCTFCVLNATAHILWVICTRWRARTKLYIQINANMTFLLYTVVCLSPCYMGFFFLRIASFVILNLYEYMVRPTVFKRIDSVRSVMQ